MKDSKGNDLAIGQMVVHPEHGTLVIHEMTVNDLLWVRPATDGDSESFAVPAAECESHDSVVVETDPGI